jgi:transposase
MSAQKRYSREFKVEAVKLVTEHAMPRMQVARDLGIDPATLRGWIKRFASEDAGESSGGGLQREEELRRLRREVAELKLEREILKKAVGIFSQMPRQ